MRTSSSSLRLALVAAGLVTAGLGTVGFSGPAVGAEPAASTGQPPVTASDTLDILGVRQLGVYYADRAYVLDNDRDPDGDVLEICGVTNPAEDAIRVSSLVDSRSGEPRPYLSVTALKNRSASYDVTYLACDGQSQTAGTLTVHVTRIKPVKVEVPSRGGLVVFTNRGSDDLTVEAGKPDSASYDGVSDTRSRRVVLAPGASTTLHVKRPRVAYSAVYDTGAVAGSGLVDVPARSSRPGTARS